MTHSSSSNHWPLRTQVPVPVTIRQYVSREQLSLSCHILCTPSFRALDHCYAWGEHAGLSVPSLFWATQTRVRQDYFCAPILRPSPDVGKHLCVKCGRWIPLDLLHLHLPIVEIELFMLQLPARTWEILDATDHCLRSAESPLSLVEDHTMRLKHLEQEDWPTICPNCHCVVMWSFLSQHRSNTAYCKHAALTKTYSAGHLTKNRFNWYPGHPMVHLSYVGKWTTLSLMKLHYKSRSDLQVAYRLLLVLYALATNKCYDVCADTVLSFMGVTMPSATAASSFLLQTINGGQLGFAWNLFRFMISRHIKHFCSNSSGFI